MTSVLPPVTPKHNATALDDIRTWSEIQRSALAFAERSSDEGEIGGLTDDLAEPITIGGAAFFFRRDIVRSSSSRVVLIAIERCPTMMPSSNSIQIAYELTRTEARVAALLAGRKRNREIAEELGVTVHTARRHTEHVLKKLGVHSRADVRNILANLTGVVGRAIAPAALGRTQA